MAGTIGSNRVPRQLVVAIEPSTTPRLVAIEARLAEPFGELQGELIDDLRWLLRVALVAEDVALAHSEWGRPGALGAARLHAAQLRHLLAEQAQPEPCTVTA